MTHMLQQQGILAALRSAGDVAASDVSHALQVVCARGALVDLDRDRIIRLGLRAGGLSQTAIALELGISQARVSQIATKGAADLPDGFSGASPTEIAQRYAVGEITRDQAVDELGRWPYAESHRPSEYDDAWEPGPGTWADVEDAHRHGLISDEMYDEALDRYAANMN
ncbi:hypothetical protein [Curtobacterium sp. VKM Ac-2887]|uniref:hypothetical protein n=1 Tax=Curtobacterium sp. VKM Ac-2887 TaxID=2783819 RepID=UPI00188C649E|nr:hypothetical protein [Curtobacterium sp. VKM Ac-2887]MBF4587983.1 hypothetical protein [Curtobacterium sp. VKM Ac-2887]